MKFKLPKRRQLEVAITGETKILEEKPPVYDSVCRFLGYKDVNAFFTYGDAIYNPAKLKIPNDIIVHERVHMKQQTTGTIIRKGVTPSGNTEEKMTPELWWGKWLRDPAFRVDQEAQGYGAQLRALRTIHPDREKQNLILNDLARILSGPLYGNAIEQMEAALLIKHYAK